MRGLARGLAITAAAFAAVMFFDAIWHVAMAQNPFGGPRPPAEPPAGGIIGWILAKQSEFYREMSGTIRAAKSDGSAVWTLLGISFAYGIFHAAGPGHGKAVISSYLVANEETARRGIVLSFASALLQALVAVADRRGVRVAAARRRRRRCASAEKCDRDRQLRSDRGVRRPAGLDQGRAGLCARCRAKPAMAVATRHDHHGHDHGHGDHHDHGHHHDHAHGHDHDHAIARSATFTTNIAAIRTDRRRTNSPVPAAGGAACGTIFAVGMRPCSGAILVLVFSLAQGLFWAGIAATFVMGLGTAITVATIAVVAVSAKGLARRLSAGARGQRHADHARHRIRRRRPRAVVRPRPAVRLSRRRTRDMLIAPAKCDIRGTYPASRPHLLSTAGVRTESD